MEIVKGPQRKAVLQREKFSAHKLLLQTLHESTRGKYSDAPVVSQTEKELVTAHDIFRLAFNRAPQIAIIRRVFSNHREFEFARSQNCQMGKIIYEGPKFFLRPTVPPYDFWITKNPDDLAKDRLRED